MDWDWRTILFSFDGRLNRGKYWLVALLTGAAWLVFFLLGALIAEILGESATSVLGFFVGSVVLVATLWAAIATGVKRLHDREKSGWWMLMFYLLPGALNAVGETGGGLFFALVGFAISIWGFVEMGCLKGTTGPNAYGPDPLPEEPNMSSAPPAL